MQAGYVARRIARSVSRLRAISVDCFKIAVVSLLAATSATAQSRRIAAIPADSSARTELAGGSLVPSQARAAIDLGLVDPATPLPSVTLRFNRTASQSAALDRLLVDQQNPASALYRQWLTPEAFADRFGMAPADIAATTAWLERQGLTVTGVARSRTFVTVAGTAAQMAAAFNTPLHRVISDGEHHVTNLSEPTLPAELAAVVSGVTGLNDFRLHPHLRSRTVPVPDFTSSISGNTYIAPGDLYTIYDTLPLIQSGVDGTGVTIAVMGQTDILQTDIAAFRSASGLAASAPAVKLYGADPGVLTADLAEASLDVEWSGAAAPGASILYVNATDVIAGSLTQAIDNNLAPILTISYGNCEAGWGAANLKLYNDLFRQANVQGQTIFGPAGDSGATDCDYQTASATRGLAVDFPASSPNVTGVGGSMFNENGATYFSSGNGSYQGSALSYIPEVVWNESAVFTTLAAGGGGVSSYFAKPAWQVGTGVPADLSRDVPDLTFNAGSNHDGYLYCVNGSCVNGYRAANNGLTVVGGTSVSTPVMAGLFAQLEQTLGARVGNANPTLYGLANSSYASSVFHDITAGNNSSPCTAGSTGCPAGGSLGYAAAAGYDLATGWGSLDGLNFVNDWKRVTPAGTTSTTGNNASSIVLTPVSASVTAGTAVSYTATVASNAAGITAVPTGTVQLTVDTVVAGSAVTLSGGTATLSLATASLGSGVHTVSAVYAGDATYLGVKGNATLNVTSATSADFTLTPASLSATAAAGSHASGLVFTVTPSSGFTGNVAFSIVTPATIDYAFSVSPVAIASGTTSATTSLTLYAYHSSVHTGSLEPRPSPWRPLSSGLMFAGLVAGMFFAGRRRHLPRLAVLLVFAMASTGLFALTGCSKDGGAAVPAVTNATPGTYTLVVSATGTTPAGVSVTHTSNVTFVVQ